MNKLLVNEKTKKFATNPGSNLKEVFHGELTSSGDIKLVSDGFENWQEYIDSFYEETTIENIIARVAAGELDLLNQRTGEFFDSVGMPKDYREVLQVVADGQRFFDALPIEIKEKFDNNFNTWFATAGDKDWFEKHVLEKEELKEEVKEE